MRFLQEVVRDTLALTRRHNGGSVGVREVMRTLSYDSTQVLLLSRLRAAAVRWGVPGISGVLRRVQTAAFGVEIAKDVTLGEGVCFLHTFGVVVGGDARIGSGVVFLGSNTVGSIEHRGYPTIGNDVIIGAGARILGPVRIGDGALIGANAVVVQDVPAGASAAGVPAVVRTRTNAGDGPRPR